VKYEPLWTGLTFVKKIDLDYQHSKSLYSFIFSGKMLGKIIERDNII
jgi:hypothetical protein